MAEKTCCDDCDQKCSEHELRWVSFGEMRVDLGNLKETVEQRREDVDRRLEVGNAKFAGLDMFRNIMFVFIALLITVSTVGVIRAESVKDVVQTHVDSNSKEFRDISNNLVKTTQILLQIESRLEKIEKKMI